MKSFILILTLSFFNIFLAEAVTLDEALSNLEILESYIEEYKSSSGDSTSVDQLLLSYIREAKYSGLTWQIVAGSCPEDLVSFITSKDEEQNTTVSSVRSYGEITIPSNEKIDFIHLFAVMNGIIYAGNFNGDTSNLVGWGGDLAQLFQDIQGATDKTVENLIILAREYLGKKGGFGSADLITDLDAPIIVNLRKNNGESYASVMRDYYYSEECQLNKRVKNFVNLVFPVVKIITQNDMRNAVYSSYSENTYIKRLECTYGFRSYVLDCKLIPKDLKADFVNFPTAVSYAFADYLYENAGEE